MVGSIIYTLEVWKAQKEQRQQSFMYYGALLLVFVESLAFVQFVLITLRMNRLTRSGKHDLPTWQSGQRTTPSYTAELMAQLNEGCTWVLLTWENFSPFQKDERSSLKDPLISSQGGNYTAYGSLPLGSQGNRVYQKAFKALYLITAMRMFLIWIAQWLFWGGFIILSSEE